MRSSLSAALAHIAEFEGGYVNHPRDPGGCTHRGITLATYRRYLKPNGTCADLRRLTWGQAATIYRDHYWSAVQGDALPAGVDLLVFDMGVNAGPVTAARLLQQALGVTADGRIGPITLGAATRADPHELIAEFTTRRLRYYQGLNGFKAFGRGWTRRTRAAEARALELAEKKTPEEP